MTLLTAGLMTLQGVGMALAGLAAEFFPVNRVVAGAGVLGTLCLRCSLPRSAGRRLLPYPCTGFGPKFETGRSGKFLMGKVVAVPKPLSLPFDPIARADELWQQRWGPVPSMGAITSIMRAQQILLAEVDAVVKPYGLTFARYEALVLLTFSKAGELPMSKIGERLMVHPTSVTNTVDRLVRSGLVAKRPNPNDGRGTLASITDKGREVVESATRDLVAMEFGLGVYDAEECAEIFALLRPLRIAAQDFEEM